MNCRPSASRSSQPSAAPSSAATTIATAYDGPRGGPVAIDKRAASEAMATEDVLIRLDLGLGAGTGEAFGCPLTEDYVKENSEYTT